VPAAKKGDFAFVQDCLSKGANIDIKAEEVRSVFIWYILSAICLILRRLFRWASAFISWSKSWHETFSYTSSPLSLALCSKVVYLLYSFALICIWFMFSLSTYVKLGNTALINASMNDHIAIVKLLLKSGANENARGNVRDRERHTHIGCGRMRVWKDMPSWRWMRFIYFKPRQICSRPTCLVCISLAPFTWFNL